MLFPHRVRFAFAVLSRYDTQPLPSSPETPETIAIPPTAVQARDIPSNDLVRQRIQLIAVRENLPVQVDPRAVEMVEKGLAVGSLVPLRGINHSLTQSVVTVVPSEYLDDNSSKNTPATNGGLWPQGLGTGFGNGLARCRLPGTFST